MHFLVTEGRATEVDAGTLDAAKYREESYASDWLIVRAWDRQQALDAARASDEDRAHHLSETTVLDFAAAAAFLG